MASPPGLPPPLFLMFPSASPSRAGVGRGRQRRGAGGRLADGRLRSKDAPEADTGRRITEHAATRAPPLFTVSRSPPPLEPLPPSIWFQ
ncbi:hypothetical protein ACP70R_025941 [Stipagrostis hirtigluma subsp. patula]